MGGQRKYLDPCRKQATTARQNQIAQMAGRGMSNAEIARKLGISYWTVKNILAQVYEKLRVNDRVAVAILLKQNQECVASLRDISSLSQREREVAALVAQGLKNREIAAQLKISGETVKNHMTHIFAKLGLAGAPGARIELVLMWQRKAEEKNA